MRVLRKKIRQGVLKLGYRVDCIRFIPRQMLDTSNMARLDFHDAVCRRMVDTRRSLSFLQIGAFDGITSDPLHRYIREHGWRGILVEPQKRACEALRRLHAGNTNIQIINAAVGKESGTAVLYTVQGEGLPVWCGGLASFHTESILKHVSLVPRLQDAVRTEQVVVVTFSDIFAQRGADQLDLLQIDTEGADAEILSLFPFEVLRPAIVHWEIKHLSKKEKEGCLERLLPHGYRFASSGAEDMLAILPKE